MGFFDKFLDAIRLNDDYDDDEFYDDEEDDFDDDYDDYEEEKPKQRFFSRFSKKSSDDDFIDDEDDFEDDEDELDDFDESPRSSVKSSSSSSFQSTRQSAAKARRDREREKEREMRERERERERERAAKKAKTANRKKGAQSQMDLNVIRPSSMEDTKDIADILKESRPVVLNLEGIDIDMAQRIIDFTCGVCYALDGDLKIVSNYIYLITPDGVETYGDVQSLLEGSDFEIPSMRSPY